MDTDYLTDNLKAVINISKLTAINTKLSYHRVTWKQSSNEILSIRHKVFIIERHFEENNLCDIEDKDCIHLIARNIEDRVVACARLNRNGKISKMAVLYQSRRRYWLKNFARIR